MFVSFVTFTTSNVRVSDTLNTMNANTTLAEGGGAAEANAQQSLRALMMELNARFAGGAVLDTEAARFAAAAAAAATVPNFPPDMLNAKLWRGAGGAASSISDELLQAVQLQVAQQQFPHVHPHQVSPATSNSNALHSASCVYHSPAARHMGAFASGNPREFWSANQSASLPLPCLNPFSVPSPNFGPYGSGPVGPLSPAIPPQLEQLRLFHEQLMGPPPPPGVGFPPFEQLAALQAAAAAGAFSPLGPLGSLDPRAMCCGSGLVGVSVGGGGGLSGGAPFGYAHLSAKRKRIRTAFSPAQLLRLESIFDKTPYVIGQERKELALQLSLSETQVRACHKPQFSLSHTHTHTHTHLIILKAVPRARTYRQLDLHLLSSVCNYVIRVLCILPKMTEIYRYFQ